MQWRVKKYHIWACCRRHGGLRNVQNIRHIQWDEWRVLNCEKSGLKLNGVKNTFPHADGPTSHPLDWEGDDDGGRFLWTSSIFPSCLKLLQIFFLFFQPNKNIHEHWACHTLPMCPMNIESCPWYAKCVPGGEVATAEDTRTRKDYVAFSHFCSSSFSPREVCRIHTTYRAVPLAVVELRRPRRCMHKKVPTSE